MCIFKPFWEKQKCGIVYLTCCFLIIKFYNAFKEKKIVFEKYQPI